MSHESHTCLVRLSDVPAFEPRLERAVEINLHDADELSNVQWSLSQHCSYLLRSLLAAGLRPLRLRVAEAFDFFAAPVEEGGVERSSIALDLLEEPFLDLALVCLVCGPIDHHLVRAGVVSGGVVAGHRAGSQWCGYGI